MNIYNHRMVFDNARAALQKAGIKNWREAVLAQHTLRLEVVAQNNVTNYKWGILVNEQSSPGNAQPRQTEIRLPLQDAFYCAEIQVLIGLATSATDTKFPLYSYNNPNIFTTSGAAVALNNLYNGILQLMVNNEQILPAWDIFRHKKINQTQFTPATNSPLDQIDGGLDGGFPTEPNLVLIGSKNNQLTAVLPGAIDTLQASATTVLTIIMKGVLAQNVTVVS